MNAGRPQTGQSNNRFTGAGSNYGGDYLGDELSRGEGMYRDRSKNLLSDAGSRFGDDDVTSHYMGQSEYGGASIIGQEPSHLYAGSHSNEPSQPPKSGGGSRRQ